MRSALMTLLLTLICGVAMAADNTPSKTEPQADYTRPTLMRIFRDSDPPPESGQLYLSNRGLGMNVGNVQAHFAGLLPPLQGTLYGVSLEWPNPFALTNTAYPMTAAAYGVEAEHRRIDQRAFGTTSAIVTTTTGP